MENEINMPTTTHDDFGPLFRELGVEENKVNRQQSFIALSKEIIGIAIDIVYRSSDENGWEDFQLLDLDESITDSAYEQSKKIANQLREELGLVRPVEESEAV